ncbi:hypothetical protein ALC60_12576 [Trachymyrmex zeteki]|uniref:Uncharacterized protein n=1 Tax=Mycetomoellerius zeteki TaxID=64791 RepID=A0A151WK64_9HYME|nr:hypothetical protein ALC60_12576 [Trachymyrmex zeteki]
MSVRSMNKTLVIEIVNREEHVVAVCAHSTKWKQRARARGQLWDSCIARRLIYSENFHRDTIPSSPLTTLRATKLDKARPTARSAAHPQRDHKIRYPKQILL